MNNMNEIETDRALRAAHRNAIREATKTEAIRDRRQSLKRWKIWSTSNRATRASRSTEDLRHHLTTCGNLLCHGRVSTRLHVQYPTASLRRRLVAQIRMQTPGLLHTFADIQNTASFQIETWPPYSRFSWKTLLLTGMICYSPIWKTISSRC